jgi:lipopolysaccharide/colanic/teichoic acid biosynthesis glycosyltransferase
MQNIVSRLIGILLLIATAPTMALVAVSIRLGSKGPILLRYTRRDRGGRTFEGWVFRVHVVTPPNQVIIAPQFTAIGRLLWRTRLDELPILISLAAGTARLLIRRRTKPGAGFRLEISSVAAKK